jgi:hypothetical protein
MWYRRIICMRRIGSLFAVFVLLIAVVCPALCFSDVPQKHSCCPKGKTGQSLPCRHNDSTVAAAVVVQTAHGVQIAVPQVALNTAPALPAAVLLPPAPRPLPPQPPKPSLVRRI